MAFDLRTNGRAGAARLALRIFVTVLLLAASLLLAQAASAQSADPAAGPAADAAANAANTAAKVYLPQISQPTANGASLNLNADPAATAGSVDGQWSNPRAETGDKPVTCEYIDNSPADTGNENQVRYGQPYNAADCGDVASRTGFGFKGSSNITFKPDDVFLLGQFTHYNWDIYPAAVPMAYVDLGIHLNFVQPATQVDFSFTMQLDETVNSRTPCPYGATTETMCDDKVDFINNTPQQTFTVDGKLYTLEIMGFVPGVMGQCSYSASTVDYFVTAERQRNDACIFARITQPGPAISVVKEPKVQSIGPAETANFTVTVQNTGNVGLSSVTVSDPRTPDCDRTVGDMKAGAKLTYSCVASYVEVDFENIVDATGVFAGQQVTATDRAMVDVLAPDTATVHVTKYADANGNGQRDPGELGLAGWTMCLKDANGELVGLCRKTGADGTAILAANQPGDFQVCEEGQPGWTNTDPGGATPCKPVTLAQAPLYVEPFPSLGNVYGVELTDHSADLKDWTYTVYQFADSERLGRWTLALPPCIDASKIDPAGTTPGYVVGADNGAGGSQLAGIYWDTPNGAAAAGTAYTIRFVQGYDVGETLAAASTSAAAGATPTTDMKAIAGPACNPPILLGNRAQQQPTGGQLEVRNALNPANDAGRFDLLIDGAVVAQAAGNGGTSGKQAVTPGVHSVSAAAAAGTSAEDYVRSVACQDELSGASLTPDAQGNVPVQANQSVVCIFTHVRKGAVTIVKQTNGGASPANWQYSGGLGAFALPAAGGQQAFSRLVPGSYAVTEAQQQGWTLNSIQCTDPDNGTTVNVAGGQANIDVDPGESITCTFASSASVTPPPAKGKLVIVKQVEGTATSDWGYSGTSPLGSFSLPAAGGSLTFDVNAGVYTITEQLRGGWYVRSLACADPDQASQVDVFDGIAVADVKAGETVTCTYVNTAGAPAIALDKSVSAETVYPNTPVTYTFVAANTGQLPLVNVKVDDPLCSVMPVINGVVNAGDVNGNSLLDPAEAWQFTCGLTIVGDTYNKATVTGETASGEKVSATDDATVKVIAPTVTITKTANHKVVYRGETVKYTVTVRNTGNTPLTNVVVDDGMANCPLQPRSLGNGDATLDKGETWVYTCSAALQEDTTNTASVTAVDPKGQTMRAEAKAEVDVIQPVIKIDKMVDKPMAYPGERVLFTIVVRNQGDTKLSDVKLTDSLPQCKLSTPKGDVGKDRILSPGEMWTYTCSVSVCEKSSQGIALAEGELSTACVPDELCDDFTNTAKVSAKDPYGRTWQDSDTATVDVIHPAIKVTKQVDKPVINAGQQVKFTVGVKNTGDIKLLTVEVADSLPACKLGEATGDNQNGALDPGETWYYTCSLPLTQNTTNTANVTAYDPNGHKATGSASVSVKVNAGNSPCVSGPGGTLTWVRPDGPFFFVHMISPGDQAQHDMSTPYARIDFGNGNVTTGYCMNAAQPRADGPYCWEGGVSDCRVAYMIAKYPPTPNDSIAQAARQAAVWHLTNGYNLNPKSPTTSNDPAINKAVLEAYQAMLADVEKYAGNGNLCKPGDTGIEVTPPSAVNELPGQPVHPFKVKLTKGGQPLAGYVVNVTSDFGKLDPTSATTDSNGEAHFTITSPVTGTATITATAVVQVPTTQRYTAKAYAQTRQPFGSPEMQTITVVGHATKTWVTGMTAAELACAEGDASCAPDESADVQHNLYLPWMRNPNDNSGE